MKTTFKIIRHILNKIQGWRGHKVFFINVLADWTEIKLEVACSKAQGGSPSGGRGAEAACKKCFEAKLTDWVFILRPLSAAGCEPSEFHIPRREESLSRQFSTHEEEPRKS